MRLALINASPKLLLDGEEPAASAAMLQNVKRALRQNHVHDTEEFHIKTGHLDASVVSTLLTYDVWLFFFPLYSFGIPAHLLKAMQTLGNAMRAKYEEEEIPFDARTRVYAVANGALYDGSEAAYAFMTMEYWADGNWMHWGSGLGIGAGPTVMETGFLRTSFSNWRSLGRATTSFAQAITQGMSAGNFYCAPSVSVSGYVRSFNRYARKRQRNALEKNREEVDRRA